MLVVGAGLSGIGAVKLLARMGAEPVLYDGNEPVTREEIQ